MKDFGLADIFQLIFVQQKTGVMTIWGETQTASVAFAKGMVVSAQIGSEGAVDRVGTVLVRAKRITSAQLAEALKVQKDTGQYLGQILMNQNLISQADLARALRFQVLEAVYQLFRWKDGRYQFAPESVNHAHDYLDPINTEHILMEGVQRLDEWPSLEKTIPTSTVVFAQAPEKREELNAMGCVTSSHFLTVDQESEKNEKEDDPFADLEDAAAGRWTPAALSIYEAVNGTRTVQELVELGEIGAFETYKALCQLFMAGFIVRLDGAEAALAGNTHPGWMAEMRVGMPQVGLWTMNLALTTVFLAGGMAAWMWWDQGDAAMTQLRQSLQAAESLTVAHEVAELRELVRLWNAEHNGLPQDLAVLLAEEPSGRWNRTDPWGRMWAYNAESGEVWSLGPDGVVDTGDDIR